MKRVVGVVGGPKSMKRYIDEDYLQHCRMADHAVIDVSSLDG